MSDTPRMQPFYCRYCGQQDLRPAEPAGYDCRVCDRLFELTQWATTEDQRVVVGRLSELPTLALAAAIGPPATLVVGEVAALACQLGRGPETEGSLVSPTRRGKDRAPVHLALSESSRPAG
jgi:hypothetical protein